MGKTYFSLSDNLNFNGKAIKIKANNTEISAKEEKKGRAYAGEREGVAGKQTAQKFRQKKRKKEGRILTLVFRAKYISRYWHPNRKWFG